MPRAKRPSELLAPGVYDRMLAEQDGHCALCPSRPGSRRLHVDHRHRTGAVRGLLCSRCNRALGLVSRYGYHQEWLRAAAAYLDVHA